MTNRGLNKTHSWMIYRIDPVIAMQLRSSWTRFVVQKSEADHRVAHDGVIKWKLFQRNWPFVRRIHRPPVNFPHKGQWRGALMFSLICAWINGWVNTREAGDLKRHLAHNDVSVMLQTSCAVYHMSSLHNKNKELYKYILIVQEESNRSIIG